MQRVGDQLEVLAGPPGRVRMADDQPLAKAVRTGQPVWPGKAVVEAGLPSDAVVPLLLEGRAIGAIGLAFARSTPTMGPSQRAIILHGGGPVRAGAGPGPAARRRARGGRGAAAQPAAP